jgi:hypothetical protein
VAHVRAGVAEISVLDVADRLVAVLAHGHDVGKHLRRVILVRQAVVDRDAGVLRDLLNAFLRSTAIFDGVEHAAEHPRGVFE